MSEEATLSPKTQEIIETIGGLTVLELAELVKALEEKLTKEAVKKYGSKDSGGVLGEILGPLLKKKDTTTDKK